uniref:Retrotransposon Copia-like N-terminal domain-containing protein n=1 Tax=Cannabis sativa TaxID=3483 RepID=A0A803Q1J6_CANSA
MARGGANTRSTANQGDESQTANRFSALETNDRPPGEDPRSPYFISSGDQSTVNLVPKNLTGCENYSSWRRSMIVALTARNKIKFAAIT